ncbi:DNA replication complex GINS protein PSF3 isoform X2 [Acanthochromis polyacanthus]|uniref:DNA replication complex GINS protein PSF3 isoform X2 n=1 Tax=Acanthochromis polyacanthus TaxID=80966 RepID=UPI002233F270|nr:DNA replication complex GINS protein PSF3 isoform X2 [Acanthochromis polyacanthus]
MDSQSYLPVQPGVGMEENFLSLDDILLSHERLPVRTECTFPRLGFLEKSSDSPDIPETFVGRFRRTMDSSQNAYNEDTSSLVERLDFLEKSLFRAGQSGLNGFQSWEKGLASTLTASSLVLNYRKRKITDVQP